MLHVSPDTVKRDWRLAKLWLLRELTKDGVHRSPDRWQQVSRICVTRRWHASRRARRVPGGGLRGRRRAAARGRVAAGARGRGGRLPRDARSQRRGAHCADTPADAPTLVGRQIGPYTILSLLGAGGMGEVYRARDTKLGRDVAIKVLPAAFTDDPERRARFEREARVLASLNHPHIGAIYGARGGRRRARAALVLLSSSKARRWRERLGVSGQAVARCQWRSATSSRTALTSRARSPRRSKRRTRRASSTAI